MVCGFRHVGIALVLLWPFATIADAGSTQTGKHFRVVCDFENERIAGQALETAEAAWQIATELFAVPDKVPDRPSEIHLFRTVAAYEKTEAELTGGKFRRNLAFSHWGNRASYIVLQPNCSDETLQQVGLPTMTRQLIAHEAAHLFRYCTMPNFQYHPDWLTDGVGTWIEEQVMTTGNWSPGVEGDPDTSTMMVWAIDLLERGELPSVDHILRDNLNEVSWRKRYAVRWLLFRYLRSTMDQRAFGAIMGKVRQLGGGPKYAQQLNAFIEATLGPDEMKTIDRKFADYLRQRKPQWEQVYRSLDTAGKEWFQIAFSDKNAIAWRTEPVGSDEYVLKGKFKILPAEKRQLNLLLGRNVDGFVSIAFDPVFGVTVFEYHAKDERWERRGGTTQNAPKLKRWVRFRIEIAGDQLRITLGRKLVVSVSLRGRSMRGPWGLGAQVGSAGVWCNVKLEVVSPHR